MPAADVDRPTALASRAATISLSSHLPHLVGIIEFIWQIRSSAITANLITI
jgi:hypothetical protein